MRRLAGCVLICVFLWPGFAFAAVTDEKEIAWNWLLKLLPLPGVSGHEKDVARFIRGCLPASVKPEMDGMNNLWFTSGDGTPHILFVAHTDELGFVVEEISDEGILRVKGRGGFLPQMYEGHTVEIYGARGRVNAIVLPRPGFPAFSDSQPPYTQESVRIWLGVSNRDAVIRMGIGEGDSVTIQKEITLLSPGLLAARAVDDRAGCAALLAVAHRLDRQKICKKRITLAWDVQEETGLRGASALAERFRPDVVFAVDTFVSSAAPYDPDHFASLPQGAGAVIRAIDSSGITPARAWKRVLEIARKRGIPVQVGNTKGGNDGSVFVPGGAVNIPLSWPGLYSHSFIERIDRRDLEALTDLIIAIIEEWN